MKNHITLIAVLLSFSLAPCQNQELETQSVSIDHVIPFIIDHIEKKNQNSPTSTDHITFLLQTPIGDLSIENKVVLKQAFKLISKRLSENDIISIITYSGFNGIALHKTNPKDLKQILYAIENLKSSIKEFHNDGIELAYTYAKTNYEIDSTNRVIMIRNPSANVSGVSGVVPVENLQNAQTQKKNNAVLLTAITLLPQIISVIKD